ncbi:MBL fold metallo-hydrolase [Ferrovibrio sp.]|uniref:MBL fold metallo-hydrolase n=1 Tax=Ferrovibrio sp. TaxID=1917215 RepID=UPI0025B9C777|nr:MBL fold metallo-hydrolase [Ferrovibrio sp.]MBX3456592.1 MBL fold metallo-hydrolase [Ferrovibrio sp.]
MKAIILGCGTSTGVPRIDGAWGACDPTNPKNRRSRGSILVEHEDTRVLVDTSPDLRSQFLANGLTWVSAVVWTHDHADQTHGADDLRILAYTSKHRVPAWGDDFTLDRLKRKFGYCFETIGGYPAIIEPHRIDGAFHVGGIPIRPFIQDHGSIHSLGFRFGDELAYSNDVVNLNEEAFEALKGVKVWIVDAMRYTPHPTHSHLERTLEWIERVQPARAILTNLHIDMDYEELRAKLPSHIEPAYDGLVIQC